MLYFMAFKFYNKISEPNVALMFIVILHKIFFEVFNVFNSISSWFLGYFCMFFLNVEIKILANSHDYYRNINVGMYLTGHE